MIYHILYRSRMCSQLLLKTMLGVFAIMLGNLAFGNASAQEIKVPPQDYAYGPLIICDDGTIWATTRKHEIICFNDGSWKKFKLKKKDLERGFSNQPRILSITTGNAGMAFIQTEQTFAICTPNAKSGPRHLSHLVVSGPLHALLEKRGALIRKTFSRSRISPPNSRFQFAFTESGQVWCLVNYSLHVLDGELWHDATDALFSEGIRGGNMAWLTAVGDDRVFLSDLRLRHDGGDSLLGELKDGKFHFVKAPHIHHELHGRYSIYDNENALWLPSTKSVGLSTADRIIGQAAVRIKPGGPPQAYENAGVPSLVDQAGNVWLTEIRGEKDDQVKIWRDGKFIQQIQIPEYRNGKLFSNGAGSVYANTKTGLQHLVAEGPNYDKFRVAEQLPHPKDLQNPLFLGHSSQGGLVYSSGSQLHLIKLQPEQAKSK